MQYLSLFVSYLSLFVYITIIYGQQFLEKRKNSLHICFNLEISLFWTFKLIQFTFLLDYIIYYFSVTWLYKTQSIQAFECNNKKIILFLKLLQTYGNSFSLASVWSLSLNYVWFTSCLHAVSSSVVCKVFFECGFC